jgi:hypothetical protein
MTMGEHSLGGWMCFYTCNDDRKFGLRFWVSEEVVPLARETALFPLRRLPSLAFIDEVQARPE